MICLTFSECAQILDSVATMLRRTIAVPSSVLEAIKLGLWDFEPADASFDAFDSTEALPGSREKLDVLAERVRQGLPLWHEEDRCDCENLAGNQFPR